MLAVPTNLDPNEHLPVVFLWRWLGGDAQSFYDKGDVQNAVNAQRFLAVLPEARTDSGKPLFKWPATALDSQAAMDVDFKFFDDMLACVEDQFNVNENCVASAGVSAGALWTDQLASFNLLNSQQASLDLESHLVSENHFFIECIHDCGHQEPPMPPGVNSKYEVLWQFVLDHPYWFGPGQSPYVQSGLSAAWPYWCGIGPGSATPRTDDSCPPPAC